MTISDTKHEIRITKHIPAVAASGSPTPVFHLATDDAQATIAAANYFNGEVERMPVGTIIWALGAMSGTPSFKCYAVTANDGTTVTVVKQTFA